MTTTFQEKATALRIALPGLSTRAANLIAHHCGVETPQQFLDYWGGSPEKILDLKYIGPKIGANIAWTLWKAGFLTVKKEREDTND